MSKVKIIGLVLLLAAGVVCADTVAIDFEDISGLTYVPGYLTKLGSITQNTDVPAGSSGTYSALFSWITVGTDPNQYAWMVKTYEQDMDFSDASMVFWYKLWNGKRSDVTGVALYDDGNLAAEWDLGGVSGVWTPGSVHVGVTAPTSTGSGSLESIDEIRFLNKWTVGGTSGAQCALLFDNFVATNVVVPEPATMCLLVCGGAWTVYRRRMSH